MPRTEEANKQLRKTRKAKILEGARMAFARKGMAATMADIAAAAEVSQGLAYRYFADKEAIYNELLEQVTQSSRTSIRHALEMPGTPMERLNDLLSRMLENKQERLELNQLAIQAFDDEATPDDLRQLLSKQSQSYRAVIRQLIVEGQATGEVAPGDPDQLVMAVTACISGLLRFAARHPEQFKKQLPEAAIILRMLKP